MLTTLTKPSQGHIEVAGYDVVRQPIQAKQSIGVVLQQTSVDGDLSVWENMELHGRLHHIANPQRQRLINQWLEYVELADRKDDLVKTLSGGMKRRLQTARALLHRPQILFLDEPTVGLDRIGSRCALLHHPSHSEPCLRLCSSLMRSPHSSQSLR